MQVSNRTQILMVTILIPLFALLAACAPAPPESPQQGSDSEQAMEHDGDEEHSREHDDEEHSMEHDGDGEHSSMEHAHEDRIPNNGAAIRIVCPEDGTEIKAGEDRVIEIEAENFTLGEDGNHWHIYVDGQSHGMIVGGDLDHVLRGLEPGQHEISTHLAIGTHEELEEGAKITVTVTE